MTTMTANRLSTHGPRTVGHHACSYKGCDKSFKSPQALAMHVGRVHTKKIRTATSKEVSEGLRTARNGQNRRGKLTPEQKQVVIEFIANRRSQYSTKTECFVAALDHAGVTGVITPNSTSVDRYCKKAAKLGSAEARPKRKYTRRVKPAAALNGECVVTGPGLRIEFTAALLPTILHTIALAIGGKKVA